MMYYPEAELEFAKTQESWQFKEFVMKSCSFPLSYFVHKISD